MKNNQCPKCGEKLSPFYLKENCPKCGVNLVYYDMENRLKADAEQAQREVDAINRFLGILRSSSVASPLVTLGLVIGGVGIGWYITLAIYVLEIIMHIICKMSIDKKQIVD